MEPVSVTSSGIMLLAVPPRTVQKERMAGSRGFFLLETMVWPAMITIAAMTTGSTPSWGLATWQPLPIILRTNSADEMVPKPDFIPTVPSGKSGFRCSEKMPSTSGFLRTPSAIMGMAPPGALSSLG